MKGKFVIFMASSNHDCLYSYLSDRSNCLFSTYKREHYKNDMSWLWCAVYFIILH